MTPLGASLIFVFISILVSLFRHLFFHNSSSINGSDDSNISISKLHTITITQSIQQRQPYNSLYEAYFKPQIPKQLQTPLPYSSFAFKKSILNNEGVYLCQEKFAAIFQERTSCENNDKSCKWKTLITVYRLPFLKKEESQFLQIDGRILANQFENQLVCTTRDTRFQSFQLNFVVVLNSKESKKGAGWTMHSLIIQQEKQSWRKEGPFHLRLLKWNLKNIHHYPSLHSFDQKCLNYVTKEEPWLIHFNCNSRWENYNILSPDVQKVIFSGNSSKAAPPFQPSLQITPIFLKHFRSTQKLSFRPDGCTGPCPRQEHVQERSFITYVFQITNSPIKFGKSFVQLTIAINNGKNAKFVSYNLLDSGLNLEKKTQFDCSLMSKEYRLVKGFHLYQIGPAHLEDNVVASFFKHSLLCVCSQALIEELNVVQIPDLIGNFNLTQNPHELNLRSKEALELRRLQHIFYRKQTLVKKKQEPKEESSWFDFGFFDFKYNIEENDQADLQVLVDNDVDVVDQDDDLEDSDKKDKRVKLKQKKEQKKRNKKNRKDRKDDGKDLKFPDDPIGEKLQELHDNFMEIGEGQPFDAFNSIFLLPMPLLLTADNRLKIISGDPEYPLVYIETANKKYLMTYQMKQDEEASNNQTQRQRYTYKYAQISPDSKSPELHINLDSNETLKKNREEQIELDRFLLSLIQHNGNIMNRVKSITMVEAKYDEGSKEIGLRGYVKPHCSHVIVAWGWGLDVYEINWDRKGLKSQIADIEQQLNTRPEGVEMATLIPFIELFATVYCLFQALITSR